LRGGLAKVFLNKMNKAQSVLSNTPSKYHALILAGLAGALNHRLADVIEYESKKIGVSATDPRFYGIMGHSITKLAVLAHHLNSDDAGACHFKEARYLLAAADGGERVLANCRQSIYGDVEIEGIKFLTSPQSKDLEPAYEEWLINNIEYSIAVSCLAGFCL